LPYTSLLDYSGRLFLCSFACCFCRPGISEPNTWPPEPEPKEWNGRTYDYYTATQEQRRREREIRALKREQNACKEAGLNGKAKQLGGLISTRTAEYEEFSAAMEIGAKQRRVKNAQYLFSNPGSRGIIRWGIKLQFFANRGIAKQSNKELRKSIASWNAKIDLHNSKLANPEAHDSGWNEKTERHKAGLLRHWKKERDTFQADVIAAEEELERRMRSE